MFSTIRVFSKPTMLLSDVISENHFVLLMLEHFEIDFCAPNKTIEDICKEKNISIRVFTTICNLYNGFNPPRRENYPYSDVSDIIRFLKNTHNFYKLDKYPEIRGFISQLPKKNHEDEIRLIEKFFDEYFAEVSEHLNYEELIAFPYFCSLIQPAGQPDDKDAKKFSVKEYHDHHSDIESKLADLKNLLLKHVTLNDELALRRKLLFSLFELEFDLRIHSTIEDLILIPLVEKIEKVGIHE